MPTLYYNNMNKKWNENEINILKKYYGKLQIDKLLVLLPDRSKSAIFLKASSIKLKGEPSITRRKYNLNINYFSKPSIINSYWAGFIAADGNIKKNKNLIRIKLAIKDKQHLENFIKNCEFSGLIKDSIKNKSSYAPNKKAIEIGINSKQWVIDLKNNYNITPCKSLTLEPPNYLDQKNTMAFICGVIDGDGCIYKTSSYRKNTFIIRCRIFGTKNLMEWIKTIIDKIEPINKISSQVQMQKNGLHHYTFSCNRLKNFKKEVLKLNLPILNRKWEKICVN